MKLESEEETTETMGDQRMSDTDEYMKILEANQTRANVKARRISRHQPSTIAMVWVVLGFVAVGAALVMRCVK